eukprot:TRINITY_DN11100_c0_g1_i1.p1 TRINITY_DN11100_c0_g1~~TRINITY_DN11100_c0_g1_i1.p1  ORF type:complete len:267 (-),score=33.36 TRINITY_DN11100_c0_g1_i1:17-817(-)
MDRMLVCCSCQGWENYGAQSEFQVLSTDKVDHRSMRHPITRADSFDITFTPRAFNTFGGRQTPVTPRERILRDRLDLPVLNAYPLPPNCSPGEPEEERKAKLLQMYREFVLDLHTGMYLSQLTSSSDYSDIHCQLMEDMQTLKLDQSNGRIIEFPLTGVSKVYRIIKSEDKWYSAGTPVPGAASGTEHIVVVEFVRRKLAFVFKELQVSQRFLMCMELLIRRAQQNQAKHNFRALTPTFPAHAGSNPTRPCPASSSLPGVTPCPSR